LLLQWKRNRKEFRKAFYWYQKAAKNGNKAAQLNLALIYEEKEKNLDKAFFGIKRQQKMVMKLQ